MPTANVLVNGEFSTSILHSLNSRVKHLEGRKRQLCQCPRIFSPCSQRSPSINRHVAIDSFSNEILVAIFEASRKTPLVWSDSRMVLNIIHVSRWWRNVALQRPSIWTHLKLDDHPTLKWLDIFLVWSVSRLH